MTLKLNVIVLAMAFAGVFASCPVYAARTSSTTSTAQEGSTRASSGSDQNSNEKEKTESSEEKLATKLGTISVTGFSRSIETSINYQRYSDKIENVVTSADISGLPDQSIADALTRLPGVAAQRVSGQSSQINIRGLTGNFIATTLNGRMQPSTSGSNFVQFSDYPAELVGRVSVYKSSQANILEGGVGGTIAMSTANPLNNRKSQQLNIDVRGSFNSRANGVYGADSLGYRVSAAYQGKFLDDTLGIAVGFAELNQPHVAEQFVNESYSNTPVVINGKPVYVDIGVQTTQDGGVDRRRGYMGALVWQPDDSFKLSADAFYSDYDRESFARGYRAQQFTYGLAKITDPVITDGGVLVGGTVSSLPGGYFGIPGLQAFSAATMYANRSTDTSVFSGGLNGQWNLGAWTVTVDLSAAHGSSDTLGSDGTLDPYTGLGTGQPRVADQSITYALHGLDVGDFSVANPGMYTDVNQVALSNYGLYPTSYDDRMKAFRTTMKYEFADSPISAIEAGLYARNHQYNTDRSVWMYGSAWGQYFVNTPNEPPLTLTRSNARKTCWESSKFNDFPCFLAVDVPAVLAAHDITPDPAKDWSQNWSMIQSGEVDVQIRDAFLQADIDAHVFGHELTGNFGVRIVHTKQHSPGLQQVGNGAGVPITDGRGVVSKDYIRVDPGQSYTDYLPSLNLNFHVSRDSQIRFAAAKVMARPPIDRLKSGVSSFVSNGQYNISSGTSPSLDPLYATQYDLMFAHYFPDSSGVFAADLFYKDIDSFVQTITIPNFDFAAHGYTVPTNPNTGAPYLNGSFNTAYNNKKGGYVRGIELQFQKTRFLPGVWAGLGVSLGYAYTDSGTTVKSDLAGFTATQSLPGLSRHVASAALFYDNGKISTRLAGNYRSEFVSGAGVVFGFQTQYFAPETIIDYQFAYQFTKHLQGVFQVLNLTDQPTRSYFARPELTSTIQYFGRTMYVGVNLSF